MRFKGKQRRLALKIALYIDDMFVIICKKKSSIFGCFQSLNCNCKWMLVTSPEDLVFTDEMEEDSND